MSASRLPWGEKCVGWINFFSWFERISIIVIVINCISLGLYDPCQNKGGTDCKTAKCHALEILDDVVFAYFAIEMVIKAGF